MMLTYLYITLSSSS